MTISNRQPLAEVFGFPVEDRSEQAERYRRLKLCPFNNRVPNCTKDKANDPLGVCSIYHDKSGVIEPVITCPIRFRQDWKIAENAAAFFFGPTVSWTSLSEVRLNDKNGQSAGNIDVVLVAYDERGRVVDFGFLLVQAAHYSQATSHCYSFENLILQISHESDNLKKWRKKQAIVLPRSIYTGLPDFVEVSAKKAEVAWLLYDLAWIDNRYQLKLSQTIYTQFLPALDTITKFETDDINHFTQLLQCKVDERKDGTSDGVP